ncbi:MAG: acyltransferase family protein, partial [Ruminococcus sp.]|nr:acyltransferase family protein [Ruminococcus sp.]
FLEYVTPMSFGWYLSLTYFFISKLAVPIFFMIMGALLLRKIDSPKKSFERVVRMIIALVVYSLIYYVYFHRNTLDTMSFQDFFSLILTKRTNNAMWYMYVYIGLLILLPLFQRMANAFSKKATAYLIFLSVFVMGTLPLISIFYNFNLSAYFTVNFFAPTIGVIFAGYFVEHYLKINKAIVAISLLLFVCITTFEVYYTANYYPLNPKDYLILDDRDYLTITLSAICFYIIIKYLATLIKAGNGIKKVTCYFGSLTFGIYLISDLIINVTKPQYYSIIIHSDNVFLITVLWQVIVFASCALITALAKLIIPGAKKII